jgi:hypothetical protein
LDGCGRLELARLEEGGVGMMMLEVADLSGVPPTGFLGMDMLWWW